MMNVKIAKKVGVVSLMGMAIIAGWQGPMLSADTSAPQLLDEANAGAQFEAIPLNSERGHKRHKNGN